MRRKNIKQVGLSEVHLHQLDSHLDDFISGEGEIRKPLVLFDEDRITLETLSLDNVRVLIVEGTYTTELQNVNCRVFIDRTHQDTKNDRRRRGREEQDDHLEQILLIEHKIISSHKARADTIVTTDHEVMRVDNGA